MDTLNLTEIQKDLVVGLFYTPQIERQYPGWKNIAKKLVEDGECVVPGKDKMIWTDGVSEFITIEPAKDLIDCTLMKLNLNGLLMSDLINEDLDIMVNYRHERIGELEEIIESAKKNIRKAKDEIQELEVLRHG